MVTQHSITASADGLSLQIIVTEPSTSAKGILQMCHGMCEHKERYIEMMEFFSADGWICVMHDHRGHGGSVKSPEHLGYMYDGGWKALLEDTHLVTSWAKSRYPQLPLVLYGHSMGSMVVRSYTKRWDAELSGLIVTGCPSYNPASPAGYVLATLFGIGNGGHCRPKLLQTMSFGSFNKPFEQEGPNAWVVSDAQAREIYNNDPLCQFQFTANGFRNLLGLCMDCYSRKNWTMANPKLPVRFFSGSDDPCRISDTQLNKAVALMQTVGYSDVSLTLYDGMRHEIHNETEKALVWDDMLCTINGWL